MFKKLYVGDIIINIHCDIPNFSVDKICSRFPNLKKNDNYYISISLYITEFEKSRTILKTNTLKSDSFNLSPKIKREYYFDYESKKDIILFTNQELCIERDFKEWSMIAFCNSKVQLLLIEGFFESFILNALFYYGFIPCHGSALVKNDMCIPFLGKSGSGKSTTMVQLINQADGFLSNDLFYIDAKKRIAYSLDKTIAVRENKFDFLTKIQKELNDNSVLLYKKEQSYYDAEKFFGNNYVSEAKIKNIFFCKIIDCKDVTVKKLNRTQAITELSDNTFTPSKLIIPLEQRMSMNKILLDSFSFFSIYIPNLNNIDYSPSIFDMGFLDLLSQVE